MPNNPKLYNQKDMHPLNKRYQDVHKNEIKFLGKKYGQTSNTTAKLPILIAQRNDIAPLLGVNWLKQLPITINKISLDDHTNQSNNIHAKFHKLFEKNHTIKNAEVKIQIKPGFYPIHRKTDEYHITYRKT